MYSVKYGKTTDVMITMQTFLSCQQKVCYVSLKKEFDYDGPTYSDDEAAETGSLFRILSGAYCSRRSQDANDFLKFLFCSHGLRLHCSLRTT